MYQAKILITTMSWGAGDSNLFFGSRKKYEVMLAVGEAKKVNDLGLTYIFFKVIEISDEQIKIETNGDLADADSEDCPMASNAFSKDDDDFIPFKANGKMTWPVGKTITAVSQSCDAGRFWKAKLMDIIT